ncbi:MAG: hypothetical protein ABEJ89_00250 [Haloarculaceae archaeon]
MVRDAASSALHQRDPHPVWRLYRQYGVAHAGYAALGLINTVVGRLLGLIPAFVVGLASNWGRSSGGSG